MKFFHPQIQLAHVIEVDGSRTYLLHVVTFCPRVNFKSDGYETPGFEPESNGKYKVIIKIREDLDWAMPKASYITPIVHTIELAGITFSNDEGAFDVQVVGLVAPDTMIRDTTPTTKTGGSGTVSTTSSEDISRPIDDDKLA